MLSKVVNPALLWCAGSWHLTQRQFSRLRGAQQQMLRSVVGGRRQPGERLDDFLERKGRTIKNIEKIHGVRGWDELALRCAFSWAGHLARMEAWAPSRWSVRILRHRDWEYLQGLKTRFGSQLHGRKFHAWRWEMQFTKILGVEWRLPAKDPDVRADRKAAWLTWRTGDNQR